MMTGGPGQLQRRGRPQWWLVLVGVALVVVPVIASSVPCDQDDWPLWPVAAALIAGSLALGFGLAQVARALVPRMVITIVVGAVIAYVVANVALFHSLRCFEF
jgi:hypothetical protein